MNNEHLFPAELYFETCNKSFNHFIDNPIWHQFTTGLSIDIIEYRNFKKLLKNCIFFAYYNLSQKCCQEHYLIPKGKLN